VQIAYSLPRNISLITIGQHGLYNLFPTDLHGPAGGEHYIISLRHQGKAALQVEETRSILLTQVHSEVFKTVYSLGKNHMQDLKEISRFPFSKEVSETLHLPLPEEALYYRELEWVYSFKQGIHRIFVFRVLLQKECRRTGSTLAHIHAGYASWRHNKGLSGNYLLR